MATVSVAVNDGGLRLSASGFENLNVPLMPDTGCREQVTIWQSVCEGEIYGAAVNQWFSDVLATDCCLIYMPDTTQRSVNPKFDSGGDVVSFADGYPMMLIGENSLADLNSRLETSLPMNRFRPNLVISGSEAFAEDKWKRIRVGQAIFRSTKPCERCIMTTVDQAKGEFMGKEPLKTLASYRMAKTVMPDRYESHGLLSANAVLFGQNLIPENVGAIVKVGDLVEIIETV